MLGDKINVVVPTGNFGNILAAVYARNMGIPIAKFVCASNRNKILTDFIATGEYNRNREFYQTDSPSMDILISSNLERMLYHLYDNDPEKVAALMKDLKEKGSYKVTDEVLAKLQKEFFGGYCDDADTAKTIKNLFDEYIAVPILYMMGEDDKLFLPEVQETVRKGHDNATLVIVPNAGHVCNIDNKNFFNQRSLEFMRNI